MGTNLCDHRRCRRWSCACVARPPTNSTVGGCRGIRTAARVVAGSAVVGIESEGCSAQAEGEWVEGRVGFGQSNVTANDIARAIRLAKGTANALMEFGT